MTIQQIVNFILRKKDLSKILTTFETAKSDLRVFSAAQAASIKKLEAKQEAAAKAKAKADKCLDNISKLLGDDE